MADTKIIDATINKTYGGSNPITGDEYVAVGEFGSSDSLNIKLSELADYINALLDRIVKGDSNVIVKDTGTSSYISITLDGVEVYQLSASVIKPILDNTVDIGTAANTIKDLYLSGAINLGSDATGDIYYRNSSGKFTRLPIGSSGQVLTSNGTIPLWATSGSSSVSRWQSWSGASRSANDTIASTTLLEPGTPVRFKATGGTYRYAIVTAQSSGNHTIAGYSCTTSDDDEFEYGTPELVKTIEFNVSGAFADNSSVSAISAGLLYEDLNMMLHYIWNNAIAYIVNLKATCKTVDSSSDPTIAISNDNGGSYNDVFTAIDVDNSLHSTTIDTLSNYKIEYGNHIEFSVTKTGTGDAKDLSIFVTIILE